jgi:hypothetical protein
MVVKAVLATVMAAIVMARGDTAIQVGMLIEG